MYGTIPVESTGPITPPSFYSPKSENICTNLSKLSYLWSVVRHTCCFFGHDSRLEVGRFLDRRGNLTTQLKYDKS